MDEIMINGKPLLRFWVEGCAQYYPSGGFDDIKGRYATLEEAEARVQELKDGGYSSYDIRIVDILHMLTNQE